VYRGPAALALGVLLAGATSLTAQATDATGPLRSAVSATKPMTRVRVELYDGRRMTGTLLDADSAALTIASDSGAHRTVPYVDVARYWDRRRAVEAGAITGGILGAGAGAFLGVLVVGLCEYDCNGSLAGGAIVGGLAVGAAGAVAGGVVGAAIPRWSQRWHASRYRAAHGGAPAPVTEAEPPDSAAAPPPHAREVGEVTLFALAGHGGHPVGAYPDTSDQRGVMAGLSAGLAFRLQRVTFGPELGFYDGAERLTSAQWLFRVDLADRHRTGAVPYAIAGAGANVWHTELDDVAYFTGTFGAGLTFGGRHQWRAEARWSPVLQYSSNGPYPTLVTAGIGRRFSW